LTENKQRYVLLISANQPVLDIILIHKNCNCKQTILNLLGNYFAYLYTLRQGIQIAK